MPIKYLLLTSLLYLFSLGAHAGNVALIIDDMGNSRTDESAFDLPSAVTFAILPHTPFSTEFAQRSSAQKREVMLHMPMESLGGNNPGPGAITSQMRPSIISHHLERALADIPNAIGINNHMGSKLTQLTLPMTATMAFLRKQGLFFLDSRTTRYSKAEDIALKNGVLALHRHVFIDHSLDQQKMSVQLQRLIRIAQKYQYAVGIAHPHPASMAFLRKNLSQIKKAGVTLIPVSQMFTTPQKKHLLAQRHDKDLAEPAMINDKLAPDSQ